MTGVLLARQNQFSADRGAPSPGKQNRNPPSITKCLSFCIGVLLDLELGSTWVRA